MMRFVPQLHPMQNKINPLRFFLVPMLCVGMRTHRVNGSNETSYVVYEFPRRTVGTRETTLII